MTVTEMMEYVSAKTHVHDDVLVIQALNMALSWAYNIVFSSAGGPDLIMVINEEVTPGGVSNAFSLDSNLTYNFSGLKQAWMKLPGETVYTPMIPLDISDPLFQSMDNIPNVSPSTVINASHPMHYYIYNQSNLHFDKVFPADVYFRFEYFRYPPPLDPTANNVMDEGLDLPRPFHQAIATMGVADVWDTLDDDRAERQRKLAEIALNDALYVAAQRVQGPTRTQPFRRPGKRTI